MEKKRKKKNKICQYHSCNSKLHLKKCQYCGKYFCSEHVYAKPPGMPRFKGTSSEDLAFMEEWHKSGHPCLEYGSIWKTKSQEEIERYGQALDSMRGVPIKKRETRPFSYPYPHPRGGHSPKKSSKAWVGVLIAIILLVAIFIYPGFIDLEEIFNRDTNAIQSSQREENGALPTPSSLDTFNRDNNVIQSSQNEKNVTLPTSSRLDTGKPIIDLNRLEHLIHDLVNYERDSADIEKLDWDENLSEIARSHSIDMAKNNYFSHDNSQGDGPSERGLNQGYYCKKDYGAYYTEGLAENIFQNNLYDSITYINGIPTYHWNSLEQIAESTVDGWMESTGHKENILDPNYSKQGIGVAISLGDEVYITQDFC